MNSGEEVEIVETVKPAHYRKKMGSAFIKGPVPVWWLQLATKECPPTALSIGLILFYRDGMGVAPRPITKAEMELFGITRWSKTKALEALHRIQLIELEKQGRRLIPRLDLETRKPGRTKPPSLSHSNFKYNVSPPMRR